MTYSESAIGITISKARAIKEVNDHYCDVGEFFDDMGVCDTYIASDVLAWLGY